jgi:hypothetical protein
MTMSSTFVAFLFFLLINHAFARTWMDVIDRSIYEAFLIDPFGGKFAQENDPFNLTKTNGTEGESYPNVNVDSTVTSIEKDRSINECGVDEILHVIRMFDSWGDGWDQMIMEITIIDEKQNKTSAENGKGIDEAGNDDQQNDDGGDNLKENLLPYVGNRKLHVGSLFDGGENAISAIINMADNSNTSETRTNTTASLLDSINAIGSNVVFKGSLKDGSVGNGTVCLKVGKCYVVSVAGGKWPEEVKWDIRQTITNKSNDWFQPLFLPIAKGVGATKCRFSVSDPATGEQVCPFTCDSDDGSQELFSDILISNSSNISAQLSNYSDKSSSNNNKEKYDTNQSTVTNNKKDGDAIDPTNTTFRNSLNSTTNISSAANNGFSISYIDNDEYKGSNKIVSSTLGNTTVSIRTSIGNKTEVKAEESTFPEKFNFLEPVRSPTSGIIRTLSPGMGGIFASNGDPAMPTFSPSPSVSSVPSKSLFPTMSSYPTSSPFPTAADGR